MHLERLVLVSGTWKRDRAAGALQVLKGTLGVPGASDLQKYSVFPELLLQNLWYRFCLVARRG